jgi:hypothetical protein
MKLDFDKRPDCRSKGLIIMRDELKQFLIHEILQQQDPNGQLFDTRSVVVLWSFMEKLVTFLSAE